MERKQKGIHGTASLFQFSALAAVNFYNSGRPITDLHALSGKRSRFRRVELFPRYEDERINFVEDGPLAIWVLTEHSIDKGYGSIVRSRPPPWELSCVVKRNYPVPSNELRPFCKVTLYGFSRWSPSMNNKSIVRFQLRTAFGLKSSIQTVRAEPAASTTCRAALFRKFRAGRRER
jgi:hypothetical protein